jgi:hypothetical protein
VRRAAILSPAATASVAEFADSPEVQAALCTIQQVHTAVLARGVERAKSATAARAAAEAARREELTDCADETRLTAALAQVQKRCMASPAGRAVLLGIIAGHGSGGADADGDALGKVRQLFRGASDTAAAVVAPVIVGVGEPETGPKARPRNALPVAAVANVVAVLNEAVAL